MDRAIARIYKLLGIVICAGLIAGATYFLIEWSPLLVLVVFCLFVAATLAGTGYALNLIREVRKYRNARTRTKKMKKDLWGELLFCGALSVAFFGFSILLVATLLIMVVSGSS